MTDTTQFENFMASYQDMVFSTAARLLGNPAEAEDISQTVFLKAFERFAELAQSPTAGGWLKTVTTNLCLNHLSRYRFRWRFFSELGSEQEKSENIVENLPAEESVDLHEQADRKFAVEQALARLPTSQRVPLVLFHFENLSYQEIAERLGFSLSKVKTEIFRARRVLAKKLKLLEADDEPAPARWPAAARLERPREKSNHPRPLSFSLV